MHVMKHSYFVASFNRQDNFLHLQFTRLMEFNKFIFLQSIQAEIELLLTILGLMNELVVNLGVMK